MFVSVYYSGSPFMRSISPISAPYKSVLFSLFPCSDSYDGRLFIILAYNNDFHRIRFPIPTNFSLRALHLLFTDKDYQRQGAGRAAVGQ